MAFLQLETSRHVCILLWVAASSLMITPRCGVACRPADQPVVRQVQGPYWLEAEGLERSDLTEGLTEYGLPLELTMQLIMARPPTKKNILNFSASDDDPMIPSQLCKPISSNHPVSTNADFSSSDDEEYDDGMIIRPYNDDGMIIPPHEDGLSHDDGKMIPPNSCPTRNIIPPLQPLVNAQVDIWQCSVNGVYSGSALDSTHGVSWLRGYQMTDTHGRVTFHTIYPGWYAYRAVHIHVRVRLFQIMSVPAAAAGSAGKEAEGGGDGQKIRRVVVYDDTTQLYFDDALSDDIYAHVHPYNSRGLERPVRNTDDRLFNPSNLIRNITGHHSPKYTSNGAPEAPPGYKAYVVLRFPFQQPLVPPPPYA